MSEDRGQRTEDGRKERKHMTTQADQGEAMRQHAMEIFQAALSAADEIAVESFLAGEIKFGDIYSILKEVVGSHRVMQANSLDAVMKATDRARELALSLVKGMGRGD